MRWRPIIQELELMFSHQVPDKTLAQSAQSTQFTPTAWSRRGIEWPR